VTAWLRQHRHAFGVALRRVGLLNSLVIGIALALPAGGYALVESLRAVASRASVEPQISIFLAPEVKPDLVRNRLKADARVIAVRFVSREQALKEMSAVQGVTELVAAVGRNPLPDAFVVTARQEALEPLAADLAKLPGVSHVQADALWARRLAALGRLARLSLWLLAGLLGAGLVAVTFNTIRLQILTQRAEIEVASLIGATEAFIRRPFYYAGALQGLAGGVVALLLIAVALALLNREVTPLAESYGSSFRFAFLSAPDTLAVLAFSAVLGALGAQLSVMRHLR
jgi:cell division transport system permease protein